MRSGHAPAALAATAVGLFTAFVSRACGPGSLIVGAVALTLGYGRWRGWAVSRALVRPRVFGVAGAIYLPWFFVDLLVLSHGRPVAALTRLVVFLIAAESLAGDPSRTWRPLLMGLLLLVTSAAETTEVWFVIPLLLYLAASIRAQVETTLNREAPAGSQTAPTLRPRWVLGISATALALGAALFFVIPRFGAGWASQPGSRTRQAGLETGLAETVELGMVGRVKQRTTVAFRASVSGREVAAEEIYWRGRSYTRWTGSGWDRGLTDSSRAVHLPAGRRVDLGVSPPTEPGAVVDLRIERRALDVLPLPGPPVWLRAPEDSHLVVSNDGTVSGLRGLREPRYQAGVVADGTLGTGDEVDLAALDTGGLDPEVESWASGIQPGAVEPSQLAAAIEAELRGRAYSLDTRAVDPGRPVASFLAGAPAHCEYFASAMALGLRSRGVPARVVGGYLGADRVPFSSDLVVRDARAHLWVEAWIEGSGWVRYDPTPAEGRTVGAASLRALRAGWAQLTLAWDAWVIGLDFGDQLRIADGLRTVASALVRVPWLAAIAVAVPVAIAWGIRRLARRRRRSGGPERAHEMFEWLSRSASRCGVEVRPWETARELGARLTAAAGNRAAVDRLVDAYERVRFEGSRLEPRELAELRDAMAAHRPAPIRG